MRTPITPTSGRFGPRLLLALALCACGGGDDPEKRTVPRDSGGAIAARDTASASCTPPPTVDTAIFSRTWAELTNHLKERGARFPLTPLNSATRTVRLCDSCAVATLTIHADEATHCTTPEQMNGETRVMAIFVLASDFPGDRQHGWGPIAKGDSIFAFASDTFGAATLAYRDSVGRVARAPDPYWAFYYCKDDHIPAGDTLAQWRHRGPAPGIQRERGKGKGDEVEDDGSYGWMACASGCCQFYTPPPNQGNEGEEDDDRGRGRGGQRQAEPGSIPYWCNRGT